MNGRLPSTERIGSTSELWHALQRLASAVFAFVLSFGVILITWVNHHATLKLVHDSSASFIYANGFLLLTVVFIPFPTALRASSCGLTTPRPPSSCKTRSWPSRRLAGFVSSGAR
jgi:uncharacterized membrane protein